MTPEFSHRIAIDRIGSAAQHVQLSATANERAALAARFGWLGIDHLDADVTLHQGSAGIDASGRLHARIVQPCVVTGDPVPEGIDQDFAIRFVAPAAAGDHDEIELDSDDPDLIEHDGAAIDIGEAIAQTVALAATPYPRAATAAARAAEAGIVREGEEDGPLAAMLRNALKKS